VIQPDTWTSTLTSAATAAAYPTAGDVLELRLLSRGRFICATAAA
jgi:hypothetical protein